MRLHPKTITPTSNDPFNGNILHGREELANNITNLLSQANEGLVISINAPWGNGKTTFLRMLEKNLEKNSFKTIFFDAFENDYIEDPFISITGEIIAKFDPSKIEDFKKMAINVGSTLVSSTAAVGLKIASLGTLSTGELNETCKLKTGISTLDMKKAVEQDIAQKLDSYKEEQANITELKKKLSNLATQDNDKPLVFIIDELDRCKPNYAVDLIEKIKHLFSAENVVFILGMHKDQLCESIRYIYGEKIEAGTYLQKFISLEINLPRKTIGSNSEINTEDLAKYTKKLIADYEFDVENQYIEQLSKILPILAHHFNLSLRDLEKTFSIIVTGIFIDNKLTLFPELIAFLSILKIKNEAVFKEIKLYSRYRDDVHHPLSGLKKENIFPLTEHLKICSSTIERIRNISNPELSDIYFKDIAPAGIDQTVLLKRICSAFDLISIY